VKALLVLLCYDMFVVVVIWSLSTLCVEILVLPVHPIKYMCIPVMWYDDQSYIWTVMVMCVACMDYAKSLTSLWRTILYILRIHSANSQQINRNRLKWARLYLYTFAFTIGKHTRRWIQECKLSNALKLMLNHEFYMSYDLHWSCVRVHWYLTHSLPFNFS